MDLRSFLMAMVIGIISLIPASAQETEFDEIQINMEVELEQLFDDVSNNPRNLTVNYRYAKLAEKMGKHYESIAAYERMLIANPSLDRVKLDLALIYMKLGNFSESKRLFLEVKAKNPPQQVIDNINKMLVNIEKGVKRHYFSSGLTLGYAADNNPNAIPSSGSVDIFGVGIPLDNTASTESDEQKFVYANLSHAYIMPGKYKHVWKTDASYYKSVQDNSSDLNITSYSLKTGPEFNTKNKKIRLGAHATCSQVNLNEHKYLNTLGYDIFVDYIMSKNAKIRASHITEKRQFHNSPLVSTYENRNGYTNENKITLTSLLGTKNIFNTTLSTKREHTGVDYYTNRSTTAGLTYTRLFGKGLFANVGVLYKTTNYKDVDTFVNPNIKRKDNERTITLGIGKNITAHLSCSMVYQNKNIDSNIQNYTYSNERITASMNWKF